MIYRKIVVNSLIVIGLVVGQSIVDSLLGHLAFADPIQISKVTEIRDFVRAGDWLFFDIDDTLITLDSPLDAESSRLIDEETPRFFDDVTVLGSKCLALTARGYDRFHTQQQLEQFQLHLDQSIPSYVSENLDTGFRSGIIFAGGVLSKGETLIRFLKYVRSLRLPLPSGIVFVDDYPDNVKSVESTKTVLAEEFGIQTLLVFQLVMEPKSPNNFLR